MPDNAKRRSRRCECGAEDCTEIVWISWDEQDAVDHADDGGRLWIVAPGHPVRGARDARVIQQNDRFSVVRTVEHHDPDTP